MGSSGKSVGITDLTSASLHAKWGRTRRIQKTLFGQGGVQGLDGEAHQHRKEMFMSLMSPERIARLAELTSDGWLTYAGKWSAMDRVVLYDEGCEILCRAVCTWSGVLLEESEVGRRTRDLTALFEYAGSIGLKHWWSRLARKNAERWGEEMVERVRAGMLEPPAHSALRVIALHRDLNGELLSSRVAAVELLNVLRPTIAVAVFIVFSALALHQYSACWQKLEAGENGYAELFVQEVRRFYPSSLRRNASAARFRMERLLISPGQAGDPGFIWYQPRSTDVGRARSVSAGAIP